MSARPAPLLVAAALPEEILALKRRLAGARPLRGHRAWRGVLAGRDVLLLRTGDGAGRAGRAVRGILDAMPCSGLIGCGVAGGLTADLTAGDVVAAARVVDRDSLVRSADPAFLEAAVDAGARVAVALSAAVVALSAADKRALAASLDAPSAVVDLESAAWAAAADGAGRPWVVVRAVSDAYDEDLPAILRSCVRTDGTVGRGRAAALALARPGSLPGLLRLRRNVRGAAERLAATLEGMMVRPFGHGAADARAREAV